MFFLHVQGLVRLESICKSLTRTVQPVRFAAERADARFNIFFSWFALANLWLTFAIIIDLLPANGIILFGNADIVSAGPNTADGRRTGSTCLSSGFTSRSSCCRYVSA